VNGPWIAFCGVLVLENEVAIVRLSSVLTENRWGFSARPLGVSARERFLAKRLSDYAGTVPFFKTVCPKRKRIVETSSGVVYLGRNIVTCDVCWLLNCR